MRFTREVIVVATAWCLSQTASSADSVGAETLVARLGDPRYAVRLDAQRRLDALGLTAFEALRRGVDDADPEIAASSRMLLGRAATSIAHPADPPSVRRRLEAYSDRPENDRLAVVRAISRTPGDGGVAVLCRLARFDPSPRVSREAAVVLLAAGQLAVDEEVVNAIESANADLDQRYGPSDRPAATWLSLVTRRDQAVSRWRDACGRELSQLNDRPGDTASSVGRALAWRWLGAAVGAADDRAALAATRFLAERATDSPESSLIAVCRALRIAEAGTVLDRVVADFGGELESRRGLYLRASVLAARGETAAAERLASRAFAALDPAGDAAAQRLALARELRVDGLRSWAERELEAVAESLSPLTAPAADAAWRLADQLQDEQRFGDAATWLGRLDDRISASERSRRAYDRLVDSSRPPLPSRGRIGARRWLYGALAHRQAGETRAEVEALDRAIRLQGDDADILIAMHRVRFANDADAERRRADTRRRILEAAHTFEQRLASNPLDPTPLNQWAWLVSNTFGDFAKAVRYSRRSLELQPDDPGLLDTLGRCLYAAGDLEGAVQAQRRAVAKMPGVLVMKRQLELFESAADAGGEP